MFPVAFVGVGVLQVLVAVVCGLHWYVLYGPFSSGSRDEQQLAHTCAFACPLLERLSKGVADMHVTIMCTGMGLSSGGMLFVCLHACARVHKHARVD